MAIQIRRLRPGDEALARTTFATMAAVFAEDEPDDAHPQPSADYLRSLLRRPDFFALAALEQGGVLGGITGHVLPMTRSESAELFIYDLAVVPQHQRRGVGRALVGTLRALAAAEGVATSFVPADNDDTHALAFYGAIGGEASPVTFFTFGAPDSGALAAPLGG